MRNCIKEKINLVYTEMSKFILDVDRQSAVQKKFNEKTEVLAKASNI
jgi:hypothetical protein